MPTTHDGEISFSIGYSGASPSGPGRFDSQILQSTAFYHVDPVKTKAILSQNKATQNIVYADGYAKSWYVKDRDSDRFDGYLATFKATKQVASPIVQRLYNSRSRRFITYYSMIARDTGSPTTTYRTWVRVGSPGTVSNYPGTPDGTLVDLAITAKWKVYIATDI
jgi:hypothetical protein